MCGIAGCYQQADGQKLVDIMTDRIAHRGPDAAGIWSHQDDRVVVHLGHRRLSIIDLSRRRRPAAVQGRPDPRLQRRALQLQGAEGRAAGSRRALRHRIRHRGGARGVAGLGSRGACAGSAACSRSRWPTRRTGDLVLARDPLGIKPLYYLPRGEGMVFASELKALVAAVGSELRIEPGALVASMLYYWVPDQRCAIDGVRKLPRRLVGALPSRTAAPRCSSYWRIADVAREAAGGPAADLGTVIEESVAAHLVADVPVSSFLSGGLDSSIVTVLAHQAAQGIDAYTITFRPEDQRLEAMPDDAVYARKVAAQFGIKLHEIEISPDIVEPAAPHGRRARRADRRSRRDQHAAHVRGRPRARRQGDPVRHGRRRAVRRLPQASGLRHGRPVRQAARGPARRRAFRGGAGPGQRRRAGACGTRDGPSAS